MMNLLIFGGTAEGRQLAQIAANLGIVTTVSVATPLGAEELRGNPSIQVKIGRLGAEEMGNLVKGYDRCVDATHPYALEASENIKTACSAAHVPLCRLLREQNGERRPGTPVGSPREAARLLKTTKGNILLTTGAKELSAFADLPPQRLFPRILPVEESISACRSMGIPTRNIIAMHGPFSQRLNEAIMEQYRIRYLVTKDSGRAGGFEEKVLAAQSAGAELIVILRPEESGLDLAGTVRWLVGGEEGR